MMQKLALIVLTGLGTLSLGALGSLAPSSANAETFSREVGEPLQEAKKAADQRLWDAALASIKKAQAVPTKKPHEEYQINELLAYVLLNKKDNAGAARVYEENLNSGSTPASQVGQRVKVITQLHVGSRNWGKAIEYGNRWIKASPGDTQAYEQVAQAQHQSGDCKNASRTMQQGIEVARKAGQKPKQNWLFLKLDCQRKLDNVAGMTATREQLVLWYPSKDNWKAVLANVYNQPNNDDRATLDLFRLILELDVLEKPKDYVEMAQMAIETGAPTEAVSVMEKGFTNKALDGKERERHLRLLNNAKTQAQASKAEIAKMEQEARTAATGEADVRLGGRYLANGEYGKAVTAIQRGLKKGGFKGADGAQMMLGRAYLKLKQKDQARKAFGAVPDDSKLAQVAQLWGVYAQQS